jgi:hypothetical protein
VLAVLAFVAVVAIASTGSTPGGSGEARRRPADLLLDTLVSLTLVLFLLSAAILVYAFIHRKELAASALPGRHRRSGLASVVAFLLILAVILFLRSRGLFAPGEGNRQAPTDAPPGDPTGGDVDPNRYDPEFAWVPVLVVVGLAVVASLAALAAARRRRGPARASVAATVADVLEDTLDDLRAEADPRRAIIAAYARLERVLGAHGLARRAPETPEEYLVRILSELEVDQRSVRRLTDLFTRAKFSQHDVDLDMKEEAIGALSRVRDDLRAAEERRALEPLQVLPVAERPA